MKSPVAAAIGAVATRAVMRNEVFGSVAGSMKDVQRDIANRDAVTAPDQSPFTREAGFPLSSASSESNREAPVRCPSSRLPDRKSAYVGFSDVSDRHILGSGGVEVDVRVTVRIDDNRFP